MTSAFESYIDYSEQKLELAIYGYCRSNERGLSTVIPKEIKDVIHSFCKFYFKWNHDLCDSGYLFFADHPLEIQYTKSSQWGFLVLQHAILSSKISDLFEWEIRIDQQKLYSYVFAMGFVSYPLDESIKKWNSYFTDDYATRDKQFGVYIYSKNKSINRFTDKGGTKSLDSDKNISMDIGSRFKMVFDFKKKICSIYHNDQFIGNIPNIPERIIPAISCYYPLRATCTKFGALHSTKNS